MEDGIHRLRGSRVPDSFLPATDGSLVNLAERPGSVVVFIHPNIGAEGGAIPAEWQEIPGLTGCTAESCGFRDAFELLRELGVEIFGLSTQATMEQRQAVSRLRLPYRLLSDPTAAFLGALELPLLHLEGRVFARRLTLFIVNGVVEHVFYPIKDPAGHAAEVHAWLKGRAPDPAGH